MKTNKQKCLEKPDQVQDQPVFVFRTNSNNPKSEPYIWPYSKEAISIQAFNVKGWFDGFRMGCVR